MKNSIFKKILCIHPRLNWVFHSNDLIIFQVRKVCGRSELQTSPPSSESPTSVGHTDHRGTGLSHAGFGNPSSSQQQPHKALPTQLHTQLGNFLASVVRSRTFYGTLADAICEEYPDRHCWNGERVGEWVASKNLIFYLDFFSFSSSRINFTEEKWPIRVTLLFTLTF